MICLKQLKRLKLNYKMKKLLLLLFLFSCSENNKKPNIQQEKQKPVPMPIYTISHGPEMWVYVIDSCEYIGVLQNYNHYNIITHKGNCKFCRKRSSDRINK